MTHRMNRRDLIKKLGSAAGGLVAGGGFGACGEQSEPEARLIVPSGPIGPLGLQLYTLRSYVENDLIGTLMQVADMGFREVEFAGYFGFEPRQIARVLTDAGLYAPSAMITVDEAVTSWETAVQAAVELGHRWVTLAWLPEEMRSDVDALATTAELFNRLGDEALIRGVRLGYHTRDYDFQPLENGQRPIDVLLETTDPAAVDIELDVFWALQAGADPIAFLETSGAGRVPLIHVCDRDADGRMLPLGTGLVDWPALFAQRYVSGVQHIFVDHEEADDPWLAAQESFAYLNALAV